MIKKILILSANPSGTDRLRLDEEVREIEGGLKRAKLHDRFEIRSVWAVRFRDLRRELMEYEPHIVHFSGHGGEDGMILEGDRGIFEPVSAEALSDLFSLCTGHVRCVILNACYSAPQAEAINKHIDYVIGMQKEINDKAAFEFSVGIYDALGAGKSVPEAFKFGRNAVLQASPDHQDHFIPILKIKPGLEPEEQIKNENDQEENDRKEIATPSETGTQKIPLKRIIFQGILVLSVVLLSIYVLWSLLGNKVDCMKQNREMLKTLIETEGKLDLDEKLDLLGRAIACSLEKEISSFKETDWEKYNIAGKKLNLLFLYNRGPHIHLGSLLEPLHRYVYERIVNAVDEAVHNRPVLQKGVELLKIDFAKGEEMKGKSWLESKDRSRIGIKKKGNAVYEILLSVEKEAKKIHIGGTLLIGGEEAPPEEMAFTGCYNIYAADLIAKKNRDPGNRNRNLDDMINQTKKVDESTPFIIKASPKEDARYDTEFVPIPNGYTVYKRCPLYFEFKMPGNTRYLILLVKDGSGIVENLIPGTTNALTNGDYFISTGPGTQYTTMLRDFIAFSEGDKKVRTGTYSPNREGEHTFYFFFLDKRNKAIEEIAVQADTPGGTDIEITDTKGSVMTCGAPPEKSGLENVYFHKVVLTVVEPGGKNRES
jgi:hypothetical protein